jgi:hypothetical protein
MRLCKLPRPFASQHPSVITVIIGRIVHVLDVDGAHTRTIFAAAMPLLAGAGFVRKTENCDTGSPHTARCANGKTPCARQVNPRRVRACPDAGPEKVLRTVGSAPDAAVQRSRAPLQTISPDRRACTASSRMARKAWQTSRRSFCRSGILLFWAHSRFQWSAFRSQCSTELKLDRFGSIGWNAPGRPRPTGYGEAKFSPSRGHRKN